VAADAQAICNLALSHIGDRGTVEKLGSTSGASGSDAAVTVQEILCVRFYPIARDFLLTRAPLAFTRRKSALALHAAGCTDAELNAEWSFAFSQPTDCLRVLKVLMKGAGKNHPGEDFELYTESDGHTLILTNVDYDDSGAAGHTAYTDFVFRTTNTTTFPEEFTIALSYYLASLLAGALIKGSKGIQLAGAMRALTNESIAVLDALNKQEQQVSLESETTGAQGICNIALSHLGLPGRVTNITSPGFQEEIICARFYATARDYVLKKTMPRFARRKSLLVIHDTANDDANLEGEWSYAFNLPTGALRILKVLQEGAAKSRPGLDFDIYTEADGTQLILTNVSETKTYADYVYQETDTTEFTGEFTLALSYYLAGLIATPLIMGADGVQLAGAMRALYAIEEANATVEDARQRLISEEYETQKPIWISDR